MMYGPFNVLLELVGCYFIDDFCICIYQGYRPVIFFFSSSSSLPTSLQFTKPGVFRACLFSAESKDRVDWYGAQIPLSSGTSSVPLKFPPNCGLPQLVIFFFPPENLFMPLLPISKLSFYPLLCRLWSSNFFVPFRMNDFIRICRFGVSTEGSEFSIFLGCHVERFSSVTRISP